MRLLGLRDSRQLIAFICCIIIILGLIISRIGLSIGMIGLITLAIFNKQIGSDLRTFIKDKPSLVICSLFFLYLISVFWSDDLFYLAERLRIKLPFLILPLAFISFRSFSKRTYFAILYVFLLVMFFTSVVTFFNYLMNFEDINLSYRVAKVLPTPINHIRFSLMLAFSIIIGIGGGSSWIR
ncbi:MAG: hypothetical protein IH946_04765 [Bacteroidetes bacterium]|nr:hypothetical protein [Bacteroidota bacterium]